MRGSAWKPGLLVRILAQARAGRLLAALLALLAFGVWPGAFSRLAAAQTGPADAPISAPLTITSVDFGFGGTLVPERWQPVVVWIASDRALDGVVSIEYQQDGSQAARVEAPFATTPGRTIPVELAIAPPHRLSRVTLRVTGGPRDIRRVYTPMPQDEREFPMPSVQESPILIVSLGETGAEQSLASLSRVTPDQLEATPAPPADTPEDMVVQQATSALDQWRQRLVVPLIEPAMAPASWAAWDAAAAVVVRGATLESMDARRRAALMTWVESGGRLIIVMDPGTAWTLGAAFPAAPLPVEAGAIERWDVSNPAAFGVELSRRPTELRGRAMTLTPTGQREGWRLGWPVTRPAQPAQSMLATGPVGMGIVTLLGIEPRSIPSLVSVEAERDLWQQVLIGDDLGLLPDHRTPKGAGDQSGGMWWYYGSGEDTPGSTAIVGALDRAAAGLAVPQSVFLLVGLSMVLLAALVGPFDFFVFRRRGMGGRTWLTAMVWIGVATVGAYILPDLARTTQSTIRRLEVVDLVAVPQASVDRRPDLRACEMAVTGLFSVRPESWQETPGGGGRWWRGVSSTPLGYSGEATLSVFRPLRTRVTGSEGDVALRRTAVGALDMPQWTFRGLLDVAAGRQHEMTVEVVDQGAAEQPPSGTVLRVRGLPNRAVVLAASLMRPWATPVPLVPMAPESDGGVELGFAEILEAPGLVPGTAWSGFRPEFYRTGRASAWSLANLEALSALPGLRDRAAPIERRVHPFDANLPAKLLANLPANPPEASEAGGGIEGYACLFLHLEVSGDDARGLPLTPGGRASVQRTILCRVLIPWVRTPAAASPSQGSERANP